MGELESRLGRGKPVTGGHANGARVWRVKGTSWQIHADAFDYSKRGAVVDDFDIFDNTGSSQPEMDVPYARLSKEDFAFLGGISLGMDEEKLLETLKRKALVVSKTTDGWLVSAKGWSPLTSIPDPLQKWTVQFRIKGKSLTRMALNAS
jgi:hypothetical protein